MKDKNFISFLKSIVKPITNPKELKDSLKIGGVLHITVEKKGKIIDEFVSENIIVDNGKQKLIDALGSGNIDQIFRLSIGCNGAAESDLFQPKIPERNRTSLFWEVYRKDVGSYVVGTRQITFVVSFNSPDIPDSSFKNASQRYINEAALIMGDGVSGGPDIISPALPDIDESMFSMRCFKSIPFDAGDDVALTLRWTVFIQ